MVVWLPNCDFHRTFYIWDEFDINQQFKDRKPIFEIGQVGKPDAKIYVNRIKEAMKYKAYLDNGEAKSQAGLARQLGVSRSRVTQVLNLLNLDHKIREFILSLGETDEKLQVLTERKLRSLTQISGREQCRKFWRIVNLGAKKQKSGVG